MDTYCPNFTFHTHKTKQTINKQHQHSLLTHSEEIDKIYNFCAILKEKIEKPIGFESEKSKLPF